MKDVVLRSKAKIICVTESHIKSSERESAYIIQGYNFENCLSFSAYTGGCSIYIKDNIAYKKIINESQGLNWILGIKILKGQCKGNCCVVYHSPSSSNSEFIDLLNTKWLPKIYNKENTIFMGDFNINWINKKECKNLKNGFLQYNLKQYCDKITRYSKKNKKIIDLVFSNNNLNVDTNENWKISDHETLVIRGSNKRQNCAVNDKFKKDWTNYSATKLQRYLLQNMSNVSYDMNIDTQYENLIQTIKDGVNSLVLYRKVKPHNKIVHSKFICKLKRRRDIALKKARKNNRSTDWLNYKTLRNRYAKCLKIDEKRKIEIKVKHNRNNQKKLWKVLNSLIKTTTNKQNCIIFDNIECFEPQQIADNFNTYFVKSIIEINESIGSESEPIRINPTLYNNSELYSFLPISLYDLKKIIFGLQNKSGMDEISAKILQDSFEVIGEKLLFILNLSIINGYVPNCLKKSLIIPIEKVAKSNKSEDMRPINMLSTIDKVLEIIIKKQLVDYLELNNLILEEQSGFREHHSCEAALNIILQKWKESLNKKETVVAVFLDLKRAFETISRAELINVVHRMGIKGTALKWIRSYLENRTQVTKYDGKTSSEISVNLGVPQGSVLGPILFIMYINDIKLILDKCQLNLFADDTVVYCTGKNINETVENVNNDLVKLVNWLKYKKLKLNINKTKALVITLKRNKHCGDIKIENEIIEKVESVKYLGVVIDNRLNFNNHLEMIIKKVSAKFGIMFRLRKTLSFYAKILLYQALVEPHFNYCATILFLGNQEKLNELQVLQNKFMRLILNCDIMTRTNHMAKSLGWLTVQNRIKLNVNMFIHKIKNDMLPDYLRSYLIFGNDIHSYNTRGNREIQIVSASLSLTYNSIFSRGITIYNSLPIEIKNETRIHIFKKNLQKYYLCQQQ